MRFGALHCVTKADCGATIIFNGVIVVHSGHADDSTPCLQVLQVCEAGQAVGKGSNEVVPIQKPSRKSEVQMKEF